MTAFISVIIPTRNEFESIKELVSRIDASLKTKIIDYTIIFVDGNSTDNTISLIKSLALEFPIKLIQQKTKGKAQAILEGVQEANTEYVVMIDADLQYPPEAIPQMWAMHQKTPVVVARRLVHNESMIRRYASLIHTFFYCRVLFGLTCDVQSGLKLFPKKLLDYVDVKDISPWTLDLSLLVAARKHNYAIGEVPITFNERQHGISKVNVLRSFWEHTVSALRLKLKN